MKIDLKKISKAWFNSYFGSNEQKELAKKRLEICNVCPNLRSFEHEYIAGFPSLCQLCGCPIKKKIFSSEFNDCPEGKWKDVDNEHPVIFNKKLL